jgi:flavine halogenase
MGEADIAEPGKLGNKELRNAMEFCSTFFKPISSPVQVEVLKRVGGKLTDADGNIIDPEEVARNVGIHDEDSVRIIKKLSARKSIQAVYAVGRHFAMESFCGLVPCINRGALGLHAVKDTGDTGETTSADLIAVLGR